VVFSVRSNPGFPLLTTDRRFESFIADGVSVIAHRSTGGVPTWISRDGRAVPHEAAIEVALSSVVIDLRDEPEGGGRLAADNR
jgi:hypothetical protein